MQRHAVDVELRSVTKDWLRFAADREKVVSIELQELQLTEVPQLHGLCRTLLSGCCFVPLPFRCRYLSNFE